MKKLVLPQQEDEALLTVLSQNRRLGSHPELENQLAAMLQRYGDYLDTHGDPWQVGEPLTMPKRLANAMKDHYSKPPVGLEFIKELRDSGSPDVCAMCGSLKAGTLDHFLPKDVFPEFAIFAPNLVPACDCNTKRGTYFKGEHPGERPLHPYFDDLLTTRRAFVRFSGDMRNPLAQLVAIDDGLSAHEASALRFHVESVLNRSSIFVWASTKWASLCRDPEAMLQTLPKGAVDETDVRVALETRLEGADREHQTPNNWYSMLFYGVLHSIGAAEYLLGQVRTARREDVGLL